jgi:hypothetical protein
MGFVNRRQESQDIDGRMRAAREALILRGEWSHRRRTEEWWNIIITYSMEQSPS